MFGLSNIGRRLVEGVVSLFAILGFLYVPLGRHTGFEHAKAIFSTPAAGAAIDELTTTALGLRQRAMDFISERLAGVHAAAPDAEELKARVAERQPRPVPPKLK